MISGVNIVLVTLLLLLPPPSHSLPGLVITIQADEEQNNRQYSFTLRTDKEELRLQEVSAHPPLTTYTPPASTSYQSVQPPSQPPTYIQPSQPPTYPPLYQSNTKTITRYETENRPTRYKPKPPRYKPRKSFLRNKTWKSRQRGPPKKRNIFPKFLKFLEFKEERRF